ncbi:MAG: hypothetical protein ACI9CD_000953 [Candidatus Deianiraeaceae bacterium]|jgi:uncharacterized protein YjbI with pentapeptide repeats
MKRLDAQALMEVINFTPERPVIIEEVEISTTLSAVHIQQVYFVKCKFTNFKTDACTFTDCHFIDTTINQSHFECTAFHNSSLQDTKIINTKFYKGIISTSRFRNIVSNHLVFCNVHIEYTKFICNSLIATNFQHIKINNVSFEYNTLDTSVFENSNIFNSEFHACSMRGIVILNCIIENTSMDYINFNNSINKYPSQNYIPTKITKIADNKTANFIITNSNLKKEFKKEFKPTYAIQTNLISHKLFNAIKQSIAGEYKDVKKTKQLNAPRKHLLPKHFSAKNIGSVLTFLMQCIFTVIVIRGFAAFFDHIKNINYLFIPHLIDFPLPVISTTIEVHKFAFYWSLLYFITSGVFMCINVVCVRHIKNLLLVLMYRAQSCVTLCTMIWIWHRSFALQSPMISIFNLVFFFYFFLMFIQSFHTHNQEGNAKPNN